MPGAQLSPAIIAQLDSEISTSSATTREVFAPFTGAKLHDLPQSTPADVADAAARGRLAQLAWSTAGFEYRRRVLLRAHDLLLDRAELLMDAIQTETGKTR